MSRRMSCMICPNREIEWSPYELKHPKCRSTAPRKVILFTPGVYSGSKLLHEAREFRSLAPSHSFLGVLSARSALAALTWQDRWMQLKALTDVYNEHDARL